MPLSEEEKAFLEAGVNKDESTDPSDSDIRRALRDAGFEVPYTRGDLLDELYNTLTAENPYATGNAMQSAEGRRRRAEFEANRQQALQLLYGAYKGDTEGSGRVFRPQTYQQPSDRELLNAAQESTAGPDPGSLFRDVFQEAFPDLTKGQGPFEKFVQGQEKELESRFMQQVFNEVTTPGKLDELRGDYDKLLRQQESGSFAGAGGNVPSFQQFIRGRFQSNYLTFLAGEKPKLAQAFELASPEERGQRDAGQLAPRQRIL